MRNYMRYLKHHQYADFRHKVDTVFGEDSFKGLNTYEYSKWKKPSLYGHQPIPSLMALMSRRERRRRKSHCCSYRCTEAKFGTLQSALKSDGLSFQELAEKLIDMYLKHEIEIIGG